MQTLIKLVTTIFRFEWLQRWFEDSFDLDAIEMNLFVARAQLEPLAVINRVRAYCISQAARIASAQPSTEHNRDYKDWRRAEVTIWLKCISLEHQQGIWFDPYED